jgi:hypothetical protein
VFSLAAALTSTIADLASSFAAFIAGSSFGHPLGFNNALWQCDVSAEISDYFALLRVVGKSVLDGQRAIFDTQRHAMSRSSEFERDILTLCRRNCRNALNESGYPAEG